MAKKGKRYRAALDLIASTEGPIDVSTACGLLKQSGTAKFDESVDLDVRLGVDPRHADQMVRGAIVLPHGTGREVRILVFAKGDKEAEARDATATLPDVRAIEEKIASADAVNAKVRENARRANFSDFTIAFHHRLGCHRQYRAAITINHHMVGLNAQRRHRTLHGEQSGMQDI